MNEGLIRTADYVAFIRDIKRRIQAAQIKASVTVNQGLLRLYWELGERIVAKQLEAAWGDGFLTQMSRDLQAEFPDMKGFSKRNLEMMRQWFRFWSADTAIAKQAASQSGGVTIAKQAVAQLGGSPIGQQAVAQSGTAEIGQQPVGPIIQIPWGHNLAIISKTGDRNEALFYVRKTIENNWSRSVLTHQIESGLYGREGRAVTNFHSTLPEPQSDLAQQTLKDPYAFDFLMLRERHDERELEDALVKHVTRFLLELGAGFSYLGRQYRLEVGGDEFFIDLLFYHVQLHCYVVVELKTVKFQPEFAGKLNFYISAVDGLLKTAQDNPTIGILICKSKNNTVVEYALRDVHKPIGVSEYAITRHLPDALKSSLPSIEEIEAELGDAHA